MQIDEQNGNFIHLKLHFSTQMVHKMNECEKFWKATVYVMLYTIQYIKINNTGKKEKFRQGVNGSWEIQLAS